MDREEGFRRGGEAKPKKKVVHRKKDKIGILNDGLFVKTVIPGSNFKIFLDNEYRFLKRMQQRPDFVPLLIGRASHNGYDFIVMENVMGKHLRKQDRYLLPKLKETREALKSLGVVHNDITRRNILVENDEIRLIDFEFASEEGKYPFDSKVADNLWKKLKANKTHGTCSFEGDRQAFKQLWR